MEQQRGQRQVCKCVSSDTFSVVLIGTGERERFVWGWELCYEGHKSLFGFSPVRYGRKTHNRFEEWPVLGKMWTLALHPEESAFIFVIR